MEQKNNSGAIFKNDKKTAENQPDYKGKGVVDGKEVQIALWLKESKTGTKYFSAAFSEPYVKPDTAAPVQSSDDSDGLPF